MNFDEKAKEIAASHYMPGRLGQLSVDIIAKGLRDAAQEAVEDYAKSLTVDDAEVREAIRHFEATCNEWADFDWKKGRILIDALRSEIARRKEAEKNLRALQDAVVNPSRRPDGL